MFNDVIKYLIDNLEISVERDTKFGPVECITIKLELGGNVISESSCELPSKQDS